MARNDDRTYTAEEILAITRRENTMIAVIDEIMPQFNSLLEKLARATDEAPEAEPVTLTSAEAVLAYRLILMVRP